MEVLLWKLHEKVTWVWTLNIYRCSQQDVRYVRLPLLLLFRWRGSYLNIKEDYFSERHLYFDSRTEERKRGTSGIKPVPCHLNELGDNVPIPDATYICWTVSPPGGTRRQCAPHLSPGLGYRGLVIHRRPRQPEGQSSQGPRAITPPDYLVFREPVLNLHQFALMHFPADLKIASGMW